MNYIDLTKAGELQEVYLWQSDNQILDLYAKKGIIEAIIIFPLRKANRYMERRYLNNPAGQIRLISSFAVLAERIKEL